MKLTVVGCSPAWPDPGGAHSGYLVWGTGTLLLDCGPGVLAKLREREPGWPAVDAIVITHWHLDHWGDLVPWVWGTKFGLGRGLERIELWVPPGGTAGLAGFGRDFGTETMFGEAFRISEYADAEPFATAAGLEVTPFRVPHYALESYSLRVTDGVHTIAYSGDSAPSERLAELARDADLFLCEATLAHGALDGDLRGHLSAEEAAAAFSASGARRLLLTHRPQELTTDPTVELAYDGLELEL